MNLSLTLYAFANSLEEINFGDCLLKTKGAVILGEALQDEHLALERLILDHNEIDGNGGMAIASAMTNKEQLQSLNLNGNQVSYCFTVPNDVVVIFSSNKFKCF